MDIFLSFVLGIVALIGIGSVLHATGLVVRALLKQQNSGPPSIIIGILAWFFGPLVIFTILGLGNVILRAIR